MKFAVSGRGRIRPGGKKIELCAAKRKVRKLAALHHFEIQLVAGEHMRRDLPIDAAQNVDHLF